MRLSQAYEAYLTDHDALDETSLLKKALEIVKSWEDDPLFYAPLYMVREEKPYLSELELNLLSEIQLRTNRSCQDDGTIALSSETSALSPERVTISNTVVCLESPTSSISCSLIEGCESQRRFPSGCSLPSKYGKSGCMPEPVNNVVGSPSSTKGAG